MTTIEQLRKTIRAKQAPILNTFSVPNF